MTSDRQARTGVAYGLAAYLWWGFAALYFKAVAHVPADEILAHRIIWSCVLLTLILARRRELGAILPAVRRRRLLLTLAASTVLVAANWFTFIWAVAHDHLVQASLGYFINPLVNVALGVIFLRERLRPLQAASLALAGIGVVIMGLQVGGLPVVSLVLAVTFAFYGLLRKQAQVGGVVGLTVETALLLPLALGYLAWLGGEGRLAFTRIDRTTDLLLAASGVVTALPLVWFANAARRLQLSTIGFLQYLSPSLQFLLAVTAFGEPFASRDLLSFGLIWSALGCYSVDAVRRGATRPASPRG